VAISISYYRASYEIPASNLDSMSITDTQHIVIFRLLKGHKLTTIEIGNKLESIDRECPDDLARTLNIMRRKGFINGELSTEKGAWVWWVEE